MFKFRRYTVILDPSDYAHHPLHLIIASVLYRFVSDCLKSSGNGLSAQGSEGIETVSENEIV
jgi:hypothetical protein